MWLSLCRTPISKSKPGPYSVTANMLPPNVHSHHILPCPYHRSLFLHQPSFLPLLPSPFILWCLPCLHTPSLDTRLVHVLLGNCTPTCNALNGLISNHKLPPRYSANEPQTPNTRLPDCPRRRSLQCPLRINSTLRLVTTTEAPSISFPSSLGTQP